MKLVERATIKAEKFKEAYKEKDVQAMSLAKQLEEKKKQLAAAQNRIKVLSNNIMAEISKQLEGKIKETEMLKEMLRSSKIELAGKDKEVKRLKAKLGAASIVKAVRKEKFDKVGNDTPQKLPIKSVSLVRESQPCTLTLCFIP